MMIAIKIFKKFGSMTMKKAKNIYKRHIKQCEKTLLISATPLDFSVLGPILPISPAASSNTRS